MVRAIAPRIMVDGDTMHVPFHRFTPDDYRLFLRVKALPEFQLSFDPRDESYMISAPSRFAHMLGVQADRPAAADLPLSSFLFDDQCSIVEMALAAKRFACWSDCGLGKTLITLEFARQVMHRTAGRFLIVTLNEIVSQFIEMAAEFYGDALPIHRIKSRQEMREWCAGRAGPDNGGGTQLGITNYEKFNPDKGEVTRQVVNEVRQLSGFALDESNRLACGGGKQKWALIKSTKGIPYKLSCTATPAPNDTIEFASQASFLERMRSEGEIIWTYFVRDPETQEWMVKPHARKAFYEFMSVWSIYVRDPRRYGWRKNHADIPAPTVIKHELEPTPEQLAYLQKLTADRSTGQMDLFDRKSESTIARGKANQVAKGFIYTKGDPDNPKSSRRVRRIPSPKPGFVADLIRQEAAAGLQVLVWTIFDAESDIIAEQLASDIGFRFDLLTGRTKSWERLEMLDRFRCGQSQVLISRAKMLGFGMNFQCCGSMIFSSWSDSYVQWYQAIRRAVRYGQTKSVRVHVPIIPVLEGQMLDNIFSKEQRHLESIEEMEGCYIDAAKRVHHSRIA